MAPDAEAGKSTSRRSDPFAPLTSELLPVGDGHEIHVESVGRPGGVAAVYLHGGPGSGCQPDHRRLFDPERLPPPKSLGIEQPPMIGLAAAAGAAMQIDRGMPPARPTVST